MSNEKIARLLTRAIIVLAGVALFLPIVMHSQFFFPFIVPKNLAFRITVEVMLGAYLLLLWIRPEARPQFKNPVVASMLAFFVISIVATVAGIGIYRSVWGNYERMSGLFHFTHVVAYFVILASVIKNERWWHSLLSFSIFVSILMSLVGFAQWLQVPFLLASSGGERLTATVGNAAFFAAYLLINLFFILYFAVKWRAFDLKTFGWSFVVFDALVVGGALLRKMFINFDWGVVEALKLPLLEQAVAALKNSVTSRDAIVLFGLFLLIQAVTLIAWVYRDRREVIWTLLGSLGFFNFFILYNTQTRGALIGLAVGLVLMAGILALMHTDRVVKRSALGAVGFLILLPIFIWLLRGTPLVTNNDTLRRLATISSTDITTQSRLTTWRASWEGWTESPKIFLLGVGPENYYYVFNKHFPVEIYRDSGSQIWFDHAHNVVFDIGISTGLIGLVAYAAIFAGAVYLLWQNYKSTGEVTANALLVGLLAAYGIQNLFVFDTLNTEVLIYAILAFIVVRALASEDASPAKAARSLNPIYAASVGVVIVFVIMVTNVQAARANRYIYNAFKSTDVTQKENYFKLAIEKSTIGTFEAREQFADYVVNQAKAATTASGQLNANMRYVEDQLTKTIATEPTNIRHQLFISTFYNAIARFDAAAPQRAINVLEPAIALSPSRPHVYFELGQSYALIGNIDRGTAYFVQGVELSPKVIDSRWNLMAFYIVTGKQDLASKEYEALLQLGWQPTPDDYRRLISIYGRVNNFAEMERLGLALIAQEPSAENYAQLAAIYARMGENQKARAAVNEAVKRNPAFAAEAELFFKKLDAGELKAK